MRVHNAALEKPDLQVFSAAIPLSREDSCKFQIQHFSLKLFKYSLKRHILKKFRVRWWIFISLTISNMALNGYEINNTKHHFKILLQKLLFLEKISK